MAEQDGVSEARDIWEACEREQRFHFNDQIPRTRPSLPAPPIPHTPA